MGLFLALGRYDTPMDGDFQQYVVLHTPHQIKNPAEAGFQTRKCLIYQAPGDP